MPEATIVDVKPALFPIRCAWCEAEGRRHTIVGWSRVRGSHGICDYHRKRLERQDKHVRDRVREP